MTEIEIMRRALRLAERGRGKTSPNPMVGAIVVDDAGTIVGDGFHQRAGTPHAEVHALDAAGARARGATLFCTLEPCCHVGRTGPCVQRIADAGIRRVVAAMGDPNPLVAGRGFAWLRSRGIAVEVGTAAAEAAHVNAPFVTWIRTGRPFVIAKAAVSLDGRIAARAGVRTTITGPASWRAVHGLRAEIDAIGVGAGTILTDDPLLTARDVFRGRPLVRAIFDRRLRTPPDARVFSTLSHGPVVVLTTAAGLRSAGDRARCLEAAGARVEALEDSSLAAALGRLGEQGLTSLLLEGGAALHAAAWDAGMIDRVLLFVASTTLGEQGVPLFADRPLDLSRFARCRVEPVGEDVRIEADVHRPD